MEEVSLQRDRLHYKLLTGAGPAKGWVSLKLKVGCQTSHEFVFKVSPWCVCSSRTRLGAGMLLATCFVDMCRHEQEKPLLQLRHEDR